MARILGASIVADSFRASITAVQLPLLPMLGEFHPGGAHSHAPCLAG